MVGDLPALIVRRQGAVCAIGAVCSHAGGPFDEGILRERTDHVPVARLDL